MQSCIACLLRDRDDAKSWGLQWWAKKSCFLPSCCCSAGSFWAKWQWKKIEALSMSWCWLPQLAASSQFCYSVSHRSMETGGPSALVTIVQNKLKNKWHFLLPFSVWRKISSAEEPLNDSFCVCLMVDSSDQSCEIKPEGNRQTHQWTNKTFAVGADDMAHFQHEMKSLHATQ